MDEAGVRDVLLARALEEVDREGRLLSREARTAASRAAASEQPEGGEPFLAARARLVLASLEQREPFLARVRRRLGRLGLPLWVPFGVALGLGLAVDRLGGEKRIDLLAFPLLALFAWNLLAYAFFALWHTRGALSSSLRAGEPRALARLSCWMGARARSFAHLSRAREPALLALVVERFLRDLLRAAAPLHLARLRRMLHLAALGLALGVVGGMYLRGLVLEYRASWESTFLDAQAVRTLLGLVLGPAAALLGRELPSALELEALRAPGGSGNAAVWIHLYSLSALLVIVLPRTWLALASSRRARALARDLPLDWEADPYFLRLLAAERGESARVEILAYGSKLSQRAADELSALLLDLFGARARVAFAPPLEYGAEHEAEVVSKGGDGAALCRAIVFQLGQTPEIEVHGRWLEAEQRSALGREPATRLLVVIDESRLRARAGEGAEAEERLTQRRRNWQRVLRELGLEALCVELERPLPPEALGEARALLWPRELEGARA